MKQTLGNQANGQHGAVIVFAALLLMVLLGFTALAVDIGHLAVVRNELQNAADAGALAGAGELYFTSTGSPAPPTPEDDGHLNPEANQAARTTAVKNSSVRIPVEVILDGNAETSDVQIGHWSLKDRRFTRYPFSLEGYEPLNLSAHAGKDPDTLNDTSDPNNFLINAVLVKTHREGSPAPAFFSVIWDKTDFGMSAEAVAYIGFGGSFRPGDFDWPIAICEESILDGSGGYSCGQARLINSSSRDNSNTGAWTNYLKCDGEDANNFNANDLKTIYDKQDCDGSNGNIIESSISVGGGQVGGSFNDMTSCTQFDHKPNTAPLRDQPWVITLPVVDCDGTPGSGTMDGGNISGCKRVTGAVTMEVVLVTDEFTGQDKYLSIPRKMADWSYNEILSGEANWRSFVAHFNLKVNGAPATQATDLGYYQTTIYALPSCKPQPPTGKTGGIFTGVPADAPVLVKGSFTF